MSKYFARPDDAGPEWFGERYAPRAADGRLR
jgi:hypothetical protein